MFADPGHLDRDGPSINQCDKLRNTVSITVSQTQCDCAAAVEDNFKIIPILGSWGIRAADVADLMISVLSACLQQHIITPVLPTAQHKSLSSSAYKAQSKDRS